MAPVGADAGELETALRCDVIDFAGRTPLGGGVPAGLHEPILLKVPKRRVEGAFAERERFRASTLDLAGDAVAVQRSVV